MSEIVKIHGEIFDFLLKHREKNPTFTFATRVINKENRMKKGYYFLGNEEYIFVPLYKVGDDNNKTKTIGFVYEEGKQFIQIVFKKIQNVQPNEPKLYYKIIDTLVRYNQRYGIFEEIKKVNDNNIMFIFKSEDLSENLQFYTGYFKELCDKTIEKYELAEKYFISTDEFNENLKKLRLDNKPLSDNKNLDKQPLNQILYGPPGTGKTYHTINKALEIIDRVIPNNRTEAKKRFDELKKSGQIEFVTFHQSYGYEEFVEGIKADLKADEIRYKLEDGVFKKLVKIAKENFENSKKTNLELKQEKSLKHKLEIFLNDALENETEFSKTKGGKFKIVELSQDEITVFAEDSNYSDNKLSMPIEEFYKILESDFKGTTSRQMAKDVFNISNQRQRDTYYFALSKKFHETKIETIRWKLKIENLLKTTSLSSTKSTVAISLKFLVSLLHLLKRVSVSVCQKK